ncbi:MAG: inositol monophosphatase [Acidobacteria bacterium]|nr:inositol monophosphatase [Acidobacteriota bacterium]
MAIVDLAALHDLAVSIAAATATEVVRRSNESFEVATKSSATDLVTEIDAWAERFIIDSISEARPDDGFIGEEGADSASRSGVTWVIDPIDGTTNFVYRYPMFAVSIAAVTETETLVGAVAHCSSGEVYHATTGGGAFVGESPLAVSDQQSLPQSLVATGFGYDAEQRRQQAQQLTHIIGEVRDIRRSGSAATDLAFTAAGLVDAYYEAGLNRWDIAAGELIVREAGGLVDLTETGNRRYSVLAAAPGVFDELRVLLKMARGHADGPW